MENVEPKYYGKGKALTDLMNLFTDCRRLNKRYAAKERCG